ncbi:MAG: hypothetical protein CHACPFDD_01536 [Phycisphaerae bacterium]|nr:hypothetical protein [Phycisphaerae bacterium]
MRATTRGLGRPSARAGAWPRRRAAATPGARSQTMPRIALAIFEDEGFRRLQPLTYLRACCELRCGRDRLLDKIERHTGRVASRLLVREELADVVYQRRPPRVAPAGGAWCLVNARVLLTADVTPPAVGSYWRDASGDLVAATLPEETFNDLDPRTLSDASQREALLAGLAAAPTPESIRMVRYPWDLIAANGDELRRQLTRSGIVGTVYDGAHLVNPAAIHVAAGARVKPGVVLDAESGPIEIDESATIEPNAVLQGPCYVGPRSLILPGASIRHDVSIGAVCKVGGEIEASIIHGYSNKQHDGFLGHSYVAEWVNLGADTVTSDLKNTYGTIRVAINGVDVESGQRFVGATIGDHAKTGIGTILPTGCVIGVSANIFTAGPAPRFVPSFAWLTSDGLKPYRLEKAIEVARTVMGRRRVVMSDADARLFADLSVRAPREEQAARS